MDSPALVILGPVQCERTTPRYESSLVILGDEQSRYESMMDDAQSRLEARISASAHLATPQILRGLLSEVEMGIVFAWVEQGSFDLWADGAVTPRDGAGDWFYYGSTHSAKFMHRADCMHDGVCRSFPEAHPAIFNKMLAEVRRAAGAHGQCSVDEELNVRCLEFHNYLPGGGLEDIGHIDAGSTLTLSVQLSTPGAAECGGRFSTTNREGATHYELARGDAILFCSEQVHNVSTLTSGRRQSMVMEVSAAKGNPCVVEMTVVPRLRDCAGVCSIQTPHHHPHLSRSRSCPSLLSV